MATCSDDDDLIKCPICFDKFRNPKYLPCLHTFCQLCLKSYIISQLGGEGKTSKPFPCPVCRQSVEVADTTVPSEKIADILPINYLVMSLMDRLPNSEKSQEAKLCDPCSHDSQNLPATSWCSVCLEALCEVCTSYHKRLKRKNHNIIPIAEAFEHGSALLSEVDEPCTIHTGKALEVYCIDHRHMCCVICLATQHRKCENISTFEEMVKGEKDEESIEDFTKRLQGVEEKTIKFRTKIEENMNSLQVQYDEISDRVTTAVETAIDKLKNMKDTFLVKLNQTYKQHNAELTAHKERVEIFEKCLKRGSKMIYSVREHGTPKQMFITKEKLNAQIEKQMERLENDLSDCNIIEYGLHVVGEITAVTSTLETLAELEIKKDPSSVSEDLVAIISDFKVEVLKEIDIMDYEVTKTKSLIVQNKPQITGGTFLSDGKLVLCNFDAKKLMVYDKNWNHAYDVQLDYRPWDAVCAKEDHVIVSFQMQDFLIAYEVETKEMKELYKIPREQGPGGLAITNDNIVVAHKTCIDVIKFDGTCVKTLKRTYTDDLKVTALNTEIVYRNENDTTVCQFLIGNEKFRYADKTLKEPRGVAVHSNQNLFICGVGSGNVHAVSEDGSKHRIMLENIPRPFAIGFDKNGKHFFLSNLGNNREVNIYRLSTRKSTY